MKRKVIVLSLVCLFVLSLVLTGCASKPQQSASNEPEVIKVGWMGSLTGDQAVWGQCEFNTVKMLFEEINAKGGVLGKNL